MNKNEQLFHHEHLWVLALNSKEALIGVSDYAQQSLGEIMFLDLPDIGSEIVKGESFGTIESAKVVSELIAPVNGEILEINENLQEEPWIINEDAEKKGWIAKINMRISDNIDDLMLRDEYLKLVGIT